MLCVHPDLPDQPVDMAHPRNGWTPVEQPEPTAGDEAAQDQPEE